MPSKLGQLRNGRYSHLAIDKNLFQQARNFFSRPWNPRFSQSKRSRRAHPPDPKCPIRET